MLESLHAGLTGLMTFARGLNNVSANVANLNTPGFKRSVLQFRDLSYYHDSLGTGTGSGVDAGRSSILFNQGELRQTGNQQDAALDGNGFFIVRKDGKQFYTRAGQFELDRDGFLATRDTGARVAVLKDGGQLSDFSVAPLRVSAPASTTLVKLEGNLSAADADRTHAISDIAVHDGSGRSHMLKATFSASSNGSGSMAQRGWQVTLKDQADATVASGEIRFDGAGSPEAGFDKLAFDYAPAGAEAQHIVFDFGDPGKFAGLTGFTSGADSSARLLSADGRAAGTMTGLTYDADGYIVLNYSNGQTDKAGRLALAWFDFLPDLDAEGDNVYVNGSDREPVVGSPGTSLFGKLAAGSIEASNVDLTGQFSELIVIQRGYQASSQIVTAANEMIQQAFDMRGKH
ncbi:MAG: flagellar hook protein FlgE [Herminiimonas sp.]|nr:flagellar hook protein FlgE [Herminiimonas sp.]